MDAIGMIVLILSFPLTLSILIRALKWENRREKRCDVIWSGTPEEDQLFIDPKEVVFANQNRRRIFVMFSNGRDMNLELPNWEQDKFVKLFEKLAKARSDHA